MTSPQFEDAYKNLNKAQKEAVDSIEGPVMVVAGPGTGKTQILTLRVANILLKTQTNPENILALTFTESGVLAMRKRLIQLIGSAGYKVQINTFHGFCNSVIQNNPEDFPKLISSESIKEVEQIQIIEDIINSNSFELIKPFGDPVYYVKHILFAINDLKKEGITPAAFFEGLKKQNEDFQNIDDLYHEKGKYKGQMKGKYLELQRDIKKNEELYFVYENYQKCLQELKKYDFNDMLLQCIEELNINNDLLLRLQEIYQYLLVDEHQDTNTAQNKLVELLASFYENPNLFVVGDEKQAIYRFQGASLENFVYFQGLYPNAKLINLEENYRSSQLILDAASSLIKNNLTTEILNKTVDLKANTNFEDQPVNVVEVHDYYEEFYYLASEIKNVISLGVNPKDIAVLSRNNKDLAPMAESLEQFGIPYNLESDQDIFKDYDLRKLIIIFKAINSFGEDTYLIPLLHIDIFGFEQLDIFRLINYSRLNRISLYELLSNDKLLNDCKLSEIDKFQNIYKNLSLWKQQSENTNFPLFFVKVFNGSGLRDYVLKKPNYLDLLERFTTLFEEIKFLVNKNPRFNLMDFLNYLELLEDHDILISKQVNSALKDAIRLMTAHKSKGLEFEFVYIINVFDGHWGNMRKRSKGFNIPWETLNVKLKLGFDLEETEDERRLFYVALTRAKKGVTLSYSTFSLEGKEQVPSQFIDEISEKLKVKVNIEKFEKNYLSRKDVIFDEPLSTIYSNNNKEYFKELFTERQMSVSALNNYLVCPWKYFYRNLLQLPDAKNKHMIFGTAIHYALNSYILALNNDKPSLQLLIEKFTESLKLQLPEDSIDFIELKNKGELAIPGYFENEIIYWKKGIISELVVKSIHLSETITLTGRIDMILPDKENSITVVDFKTGTPKSRGEIEGLTKSSNGEYKRQILFYKLLMDRFLNHKYNMTGGIISFVEPDKKGKYHKHSIEFTEKEVKSLEEEIKLVCDDIVNLRFWNKRCDDNKCEYCSLRDLIEPDVIEKRKISVNLGSIEKNLIKHKEIIKEPLLVNEE